MWRTAMAATTTMLAARVTLREPLSKWSRDVPLIVEISVHITAVMVTVVPPNAGCDTANHENRPYGVRQR